MSASPRFLIVNAEAGATNMASNNCQRSYLHVLPVLQRDPFDDVSISDVKLLNVRADWSCDADLVPQNGVRIYTPYPNKHFFSGGSDNCALGWLVALPDGIRHGNITMEWQVTLSDHQVAITHTIDLDFSPSDNKEHRIWSMDIGNYWQHTCHAGLDPVPRIGLNRFAHYRATAIARDRRTVIKEACEGADRQLSIAEHLTLPAIDITDCWTIQRYGGMSPEALLEDIERLTP